MNTLKLTQFGNPILRAKPKTMKSSEITSAETQELIKNMHHTLVDKKLGIGLAAPQVGESVSLAVIHIQKTPTRKNVEEFELTIINPVIKETFGKKTEQWEGCISSGQGKAGLFAKVPRYKKIKLEYLDEKAQKHAKIFEGLPAHVIQHEVDHLNGILFVDKVKDTKTYMTYSEYKKARKLKLLD